MILFKIPNRNTGAILFQLDCDSRRVCAEMAVEAKTDLRGAEGILAVGPVDTWMMYAVRHYDAPRFYAGCRGAFTEHQARGHWHGGDRPEHDAKMMVGVKGLLALAKAHGWPMGEAVAERPAVKEGA